SRREVAHRQQGCDRLPRFDANQVDDRDAAGGAPGVGQLPDLELEDTATVGEEEEAVVGAGGDNAVDAVFLAQGHPGHAAAAAVLLAVGAVGDPLDVTAVGNHDQDADVGDEILVGDLARYVLDQRAALVAELVAELDQLFPDYRQDLCRVGQQLLQPGDLLEQIAVLVLDLVPLQRGQAAQLHVEDGVGLDLGEAEAIDEV